MTVGLRKEHAAGLAVAELARKLWDDARTDLVGEYGDYRAKTKAGLFCREPGEFLLDPDYATGARTLDRVAHVGAVVLLGASDARRNEGPLGTRFPSRPW